MDVEVIESQSLETPRGHSGAPLRLCINQICRFALAQLCDYGCTHRFVTV